jgi:pyrroline-5-carboxylate reductase
MGSILMQAFCRQKVLQPGNIAATVNHAERTASLSSKYGIEVTTDNRAAIRNADVILLCVKPQTLGDVVQEIEHDLRPGQLVISIAASVPTSYIEQRLPPALRSFAPCPTRRPWSALA